MDGRKRAAEMDSDEDSDGGDDVTKHALYSDEPDWSAVELEARRRGVQVNDLREKRAALHGALGQARGPL